jgi:hypothetical protein
MAALSISRAWDDTKAVLARDGRLISTVALALLLLPGSVLGVAVPTAITGTAPMDESIALPMMLVALIGLVGRLAIARLALGGGVSVGQAMVQAAKQALSVLAAFLVVVIPMTLALAPFLPGVLQAPQNPSPTAAWAMLAILVVGFAFGVRLLATVVPDAMANGGGPLRLLKNSWTLTQGHWLRLVGFVLLFFIGAMVATRAVQWVLGGALTVALGSLEPMTLSALVLAIVLALIGTMFTILFIVMLTCIFVQLTGQAQQASVPRSGS